MSKAPYLNLGEFHAHFHELIEAAKREDESERASVRSAADERSERVRQVNQRARELVSEAFRAGEANVALHDIPDLAPGLIGYRLEWTVTQPARQLAFIADETNGRFWWGWQIAHSATEWHEADPERMGPEELDALVDALALNGDSWRRGEIPSAGPPELEGATPPPHRAVGSASYRTG